MSRGPGLVQRAIVAAFDAEPARRFTVEELAAAAFPGEAVTRSHLSSVRRALAKLPGLRTTRIGAPRTGGWSYKIERATG